MEGTRGLIRATAAIGALSAMAACTMIGAEQVGTSTPTPVGEVPRVDIERPSTEASVPEAVPYAEPPSRGGNMEQYELRGRRYRVLNTSQGYDERGVASWYGEQFHGRPTSNGERFDMNQPSAAHRTLPLPSWVRVTNLANGREIVVRINDRGPFHDPDRRIIDLSYAAARDLGIVETGTASVRVQAVAPYQVRRARPDGSR
ncbi:MAG: septal ring lytic transglycosylase RlpA family protein [Gemmatimonadota bacterium]